MVLYFTLGDHFDSIIKWVKESEEAELMNV